MSTHERGPEAELETNYLEHRSKIQPGNKSRDQTRGRYTYIIAQARASDPGLSLNGAPDEWVEGVLMEIPGNPDKVSSGLLVSSGPLRRETARGGRSMFPSAP